MAKRNSGGSYHPIVPGSSEGITRRDQLADQIMVARIAAVVDLHNMTVGERADMYRGVALMAYECADITIAVGRETAELPPDVPLTSNVD